MVILRDGLGGPLYFGYTLLYLHCAVTVQPPLGSIIPAVQ